MQFFVLVLLVCLFIFLYCVYVLANDDFIFLRRDITMEKLFNIIFLGSLISLFTARLFYGFSAKDIFSNPLVFLAIPYFPGLSLLGAVAGAGIYILFLAKRREPPLPLRRICDLFSIAFLLSLPVGFLGYLLFSEAGVQVARTGSQAVIYFILFIIFLKFFLPRLLNGKFKEGTITLLFLIVFSAVSLAGNHLEGKLAINFEDVILSLVFLISLGVLVKQENLAQFLKKNR